MCSMRRNNFEDDIEPIILEALNANALASDGAIKSAFENTPTKASPKIEKDKIISETVETDTSDNRHSHLLLVVFFITVLITTIAFGALTLLRNKHGNEHFSENEYIETEENTSRTTHLSTTITTATTTLKISITSTSIFKTIQTQTTVTTASYKNNNSKKQSEGKYYSYADSNGRNVQTTSTTAIFEDNMQENTKTKQSKTNKNIQVYEVETSFTHAENFYDND